MSDTRRNKRPTPPFPIRKPWQEERGPRYGNRRKQISRLKKLSRKRRRMVEKQKFKKSDPDELTTDKNWDQVNEGMWDK